MLQLRGVTAHYGAIQALFGIDLDVEPGSIVAVMGRNGMGKTTAVRTIMGLLPATAGRVVMDGRDITAASPFRIARAGVGLVPEGRHIFPNLTVEENIRAAPEPKGPRRRWPLERLYELFPNLAERRGAAGFQLSGGEQQMLAIARALYTEPKLLLLDEATEGLAPALRRAIWSTIEEVSAEGVGVLVIDRDMAAIERCADRCVVLKKGLVAWTGDRDALMRERDEVTGHLTV